MCENTWKDARKKAVRCLVEGNEEGAREFFDKAMALLDDMQIQKARLNLISAVLYKEERAKMLNEAMDIYEEAILCGARKYSYALVTAACILDEEERKEEARQLLHGLYNHIETDVKRRIFCERKEADTRADMDAFHDRVMGKARKKAFEDKPERSRVYDTMNALYREGADCEEKRLYAVAFLMYMDILRLNEECEVWGIEGDKKIPAAACIKIAYIVKKRRLEYLQKGLEIYEEINDSVGGCEAEELKCIADIMYCHTCEANEEGKI